jgi:membrane protein DedA with SNARE-associated domain
MILGLAWEVLVTKNVVDKRHKKKKRGRKVEKTVPRHGSRSSILSVAIYPISQHARLAGGCMKIGPTIFHQHANLSREDGRKG